MQILVPTAGPEPAEANAAYVIRIAQGLGAGVLVLHVRVGDEPEAGWMDTAAAFAEAAGDTGVAVDSVQRVPAELKDRAAEVAEAIAEVARESDCSLIVMGTSPQAKLSDWVSSRVAQESDIPVVIVPRLEA